MKLFKIFTLAATLLISACGAKASDDNIEVLAPQEFRTRLSEATNGYLLDVRKPEEFAAGHLQGAHLLNWLDTEKFKQDADSIDKAKTIYIYCRSGRRSNAAAHYLTSLGYRVVDMKGGILAWENEGLPVTTETTERETQD